MPCPKLESEVSCLVPPAPLHPSGDLVVRLCHLGCRHGLDHLVDPRAPDMAITTHDFQESQRAGGFPPGIFLNRRGDCQDDRDIVFYLWYVIVDWFAS